jgi:translocation protein SEC62
MQAQLAADAAKNGMTVPQFIEFIKQKQAEAIAAQRAAQAQQQQQPGQPPAQGQAQPQEQAAQQPQPITPGPPNPKAIALATFLKSQDLKMRTCILNGQRKDMFKGVLLPLPTPPQTQPLITPQ